MDNLEIDPEVLDAVASIVEGYCKKQREVIETYFRNVNAQSSEWTDDETMGKLIQEIQLLNTTVNSIMDEISSSYPKYFRDKAEQIRSRPKL